LRFNFRGVGASTGSYEEGIGERGDVSAALYWLEAHDPELPFVADGFSFGSMVGLSVGAADERAVGLFGLGIPFRNLNYDFDFLGQAGVPILVVQGENDEFGSGEEVAALVEKLGSHITLVRIAGADHFFTDGLDELREAVRGYYQSGPGAQLLVSM
jgi:alpha/beta superfamily hydrolase